MFNKLKVKVAEEVKNSQQRLQQFTQSFTEKIDNAANEENFFTIGDDDGQTSSSNTESGFSNVPLTSYSSTPNSGHVRRSSNTSIASDISFLPHYESPTNLYHVQSDLDISASEVEDNASTSSQLGHLSKEQIYSAFQKAQQRYHKYRGRYTDIAKHYKDLERENNKIRSILVETQDKALRRISELREQCSLEQKAKAHLESSLRVELDEKQYVIDSLKTKVDLLQNHKSRDLDKPNSLINLGEIVNENDLTLNSHIETLTKELKDAKTENETLNDKIQEMKANTIVFNSKETDFKKRITEVEEINRLKDIELSEVLERERENNLIIAQTKMELHTEIQNRDLEIENLKHDVETLKSDLDKYETKLKTAKDSIKLENLQTQNTKLIEKVEDLTQKCNNYESDLIKMQQYKIENQNLQQSIERHDELVDEYKKCIKEKEELLQQQKLEHESELSSLRDSAKQSLLTLESKIKNRLQDDFSAKEEAITAAFQSKIQQLSEADNRTETQLELLDKVEKTKNLEIKQKELETMIETEKDRYKSLEATHLDLILECSQVRTSLSDLENENRDLTEEVIMIQNQNAEMKQNIIASQNESSALYEENSNLRSEIETIQSSNVVLQNDVTKVRLEIETIKASNATLENDNAQLRTNKDAENLSVKLKAIITDLQNNVSTLQNEKSDLEDKRKSLQNENDDLQNRITKLEVKYSDLSSVNNSSVLELTEQCSKLEQQLKGALHTNEECQRRLTEKENALVQYEKLMNDNKTELENLQKKLQQLSQSAENQKLQAQEKLQEQKNKFHDEIQSLNAEVTKFKDHNVKIQGFIDEYKLKLTEYETRSSETSIQLQTLTSENVTLKNEVTKLKDLVETSDSINTNLTQQLNNVTEENRQIFVFEELINQHVEDKTDSLADKIKIITQLNLELKENSLQQETNSNSKLKEISNENRNLVEQIAQLQTESANNHQNYAELKLQVSSYEEKCKNLGCEIKVLNDDLTNCKKELLHLSNVEKDNQILKTEKGQLHNDLSQAQASINEVNESNNQLGLQVSKMQEQEKVLTDKLKELEDIKIENARILDEISELKRRNNELLLDYKQITAENEEIVTELADTKLKLETVFTEKQKNIEIAKKIEMEKAELLNELKQYRNELDKIKKNSLEMENIQELENLIDDNRNLKLLQVQLEEKCEQYEKQQKIIEGQLRELENQYTEISHEKQLLQDEIQELKVSPINVINSQNLDNLEIFHANKIAPLEMPNDVTATITDGGHQKEIEELNEKLIQYKSLDLTNRSSLQFYENELQKLRNKNEKLNRKLDETLVTLNHCAELSHSTETEYLKNVLYNYMLGKESIVLARVIAAVCKFDEDQTNMILQREQQKQTLLGQLGFL